MQYIQPGYLVNDAAFATTINDVICGSGVGGGVGGAGTNGDDVIGEDAEWQETLSERLKMTRFVVQKVLMPSVLMFGIIGNVLNVAVLTRRWMKSSTNYYLTTLAIYDVLYITLVYVMSYNVVSLNFWVVWTKNLVLRPLTNAASNTGVWLTLTFTVERYIGVCHPMKGKVRDRFYSDKKYVFARLLKSHALLLKVFPCKNNQKVYQCILIFIFYFLFVYTIFI